MKASLGPLAELLRRNGVTLPLASSAMASKLLQHPAYNACIVNESGREIVELLYGATVTGTSSPRSVSLKIIPFESGGAAARSGAAAARFAALETQLRFSWVGWYVPRLPQYEIETPFGDGEIPGRRHEKHNGFPGLCSNDDSACIAGEAAIVLEIV